MVDKNKSLIVFQGKGIRRLWHDDEWYYSIVDIIAVLTEQEDHLKARKYWNKLSQRLREEGSEVVTNCHRLKLPAPDGKLRLTDCANTQSTFRIIQSVPSKKAEPLKIWLAKVGHERIQEIENPELAQRRMKEIFRAKGYSDDWIEKRVRGIAIRDELTDEWDKRGVKDQKEYAILTAEISKATFGLTPSEYKKLKGLKSENLRDHMEDLELIFTMLGESSTTKIARKKDALGFVENKDAAKRGGAVAGTARKQLERETGEKVASNENYLHLTEKKKKKLIKSKK
ncbi:phage antirepressor protein [Candidatus Woesearchaeota archaeon]|jgi:DNA-damage-inducible protein D|nr:phage antirepressor protein [Candidatus Woesearchaeota archaeon]MBT6518261.1 phage antirepressor protein [Candidatus Woesearchaeota archaeon]MBT7367568.1 phage antirepressor protein [Candidatus Woesearchaeota archaeon]